MEKVLIKSPTSSHIETSINQALIRLNNKYKLTGETDVVPYYDGDKIKAVFSIGIKNNNGLSSYSVISIGECDIIWGITYNKITPIENRNYLYRDNKNIWYLLNSKGCTPITSKKTYVNLETGEIYLSNEEGNVRKISDFLTRGEVNTLLNPTISSVTQADWEERNDQSSAYILNKPTSFSDLECDIEYSIIENEVNNENLYSSYTLTKNGSPIGETIDIPKDYNLKDGELLTVTSGDKETDGKFFNNSNFNLGDPYFDFTVGIKNDNSKDSHVYVSLQELVSPLIGGDGINVFGNTISAKVQNGNGLRLYTEGIKVEDVTNTRSGAMTPEDFQKLDEIDADDLVDTESLLNGDIEVKTANTTNSLISENRVEKKSTSGFKIRSTAEKLSVESGEAILEYLSGEEGICELNSLIAYSSNAIIPENKRPHTQINSSNKGISTYSTLNSSLFWFPCVKGVLSESVSDLQNNGYAITANKNPIIGIVGFTYDEPTPTTTSVDEILTPVTTVFSNQAIHYLPPEDGWLVISIKESDSEKLCARLSWSGGFNLDYETPESDSISLQDKAIRKTIGRETVYDYWFDDDGELTFHKSYGTIDVSTEDWGELRTTNDSIDQTDYKINYRGSLESIQVLSPELKILPVKMWIDDVEFHPVSRIYTFGDEGIHTIRFRFNGVELPEFAFYGLDSITSVICPNNAKILGSCCFMNCTNLDSVIISPNISIIGAKCFYGCSSLRFIDVLPPTPPTIFDTSFSETCDFYVSGTEEILDDYENSSEWSKFGERLKLGEYVNYFYSYSELVGLIKESTNFVLGIDNLRVTDLGIVNLISRTPESGTIYYELKEKFDVPLNISSHINVWDYGTEYIKGGRCEEIKISYLDSLYNNLRHHKLLLDEKLDRSEVDTEMSDTSTNPVQNRIIKNYIDLSINDTLNNVIDLSRVDVNGNPLPTRNTANCYVVKKPGRYKIPLVYGNSIKNGEVNTQSYQLLSYFINDDIGNITPPYIETDCQSLYPQVLWWSSYDLIKDLEILPGNPTSYLAFTIRDFNFTRSTPHAVIGICDSRENSISCIWSWHIWMFGGTISPVDIWNRIPAEGPTGGTKYTMMNVSLGNNIYYGYPDIFYQWGRKDPIPQRNANNYIYRTNLFSTYKDSIQNPHKFGSSYGNQTDRPFWAGTYTTYYNGYLWGGISNDNSIKTIFDPCPVGWKVPPRDVFRGFTTTGGSVVTREEINRIGIFFNYGYAFKRYFGDLQGTTIYSNRYYMRNDGTVQEVTYGACGAYWTASGYYKWENGYICNSYSLTNESYRVNPLTESSPGYGYYIRPAQE